MSCRLTDNVARIFEDTASISSNFGCNDLHSLAFVDRTPPSSISANLVRSFNAERAMAVDVRASAGKEAQSPTSTLRHYLPTLLTYLLTLCVVLAPVHVLSSSFPVEKED